MLLGRTCVSSERKTAERGSHALSEMALRSLHTGLAAVVRGQWPPEEREREYEEPCALIVPIFFFCLSGYLHVT
jgi:hypothetical protein